MAEARTIKFDDLAASYIGQSVNMQQGAPKKSPRKAVKARGKKRRTGTLAELVDKCPSAAIIWIALCELAKGSAIVTPTRRDISDATGIARMATISNALSALNALGWIDRILVPFMDGGRQTATGVRIVLRRPYGAENASNGKSAVRSGKRAKGKARKPLQDFPTEGGDAGHASGVPSPPDRCALGERG